MLFAFKGLPEHKTKESAVTRDFAPLNDGGEAEMDARHTQELQEATEAANADLSKNQTSAEIFSAIGALPSMVPGVGLFLPMYPEVRSDAMKAVHAQAQESADAIGELQHQHAAERAAAGKVADAMMAAPRGDELHLPLTLNPFEGDPKQSAAYENGYSYAQARGHMTLNQTTEGDVQRWSGSSPAWRAGFAEACRKLGVGRVGDAVDPAKVSSLSPEVRMTTITTFDPSKCAMGPGMSAMLGAGLGAAAGGLAGGVGGHDQDMRLMDHTFGLLEHQNDQSVPVPTFEGRVSDPAVDAARGFGADLRPLLPSAAESYLPNSNGGNAGLGGAVAGAGLGGALGYGANRMKNPSKIAAFVLNTDSDVEGSAIAVLEAKHAAIGTTLGTLAGVSGGALLGHYATPAMHWAVSPGDGAAMHDLAQTQVAGPAADTVDPSATPEAREHAQQLLQEGLHHMQDPNFVHGAQAGSTAAHDSAWSGMSDIGTIAGAGVGGIAGHQLGRGLDQAFGLEKRERPLVISPMAPRPY